MKRILAFAVVMFLIMTVCGCEKQNGLEDKYTDIADYFVYENTDYYSPLAMAAGEGAEMFTAEQTDDGLFVRRYDENGGIVNEFPADYSKIYDMY